MRDFEPNRLLLISFDQAIFSQIGRLGSFGAHQVYVFNSLPILKILNEAPGYHTAHTTTTTIFEYKVKLGPGVASALSIVNFGFCLLIIAIYLAVVKPTKEVQ